MKTAIWIAAFLAVAMLAYVAIVTQDRWNPVDVAEKNARDAEREYSASVDPMKARLRTLDNRLYESTFGEAISQTFQGTMLASDAEAKDREAEILRRAISVGDLTESQASPLIAALRVDAEHLRSEAAIKFGRSADAQQRKSKGSHYQPEWMRN